MEKRHYLLLKRHNQTGMRYLCYHRGTEESCFKYRGSGLYWKKHLSKYGNDVSTIILKDSDERSIISEEGKKYSKIWDIVNSENFANLIIEDANMDTSRFRTPEAREKRHLKIKERHLNFGMSDGEIEARIKGIRAMHTPESRLKASMTFQKRIQSEGFSDNEIRRMNKRKERFSKGLYSEKEKISFKISSERLKGKNMKERLNNPNWVDPRKGKKFHEIYREGYVHPKQGKKLKDLKGDDYIIPTSKPFKLIINGDKDEYFESEKDFMEKTKLTSPMLHKIRKNDIHIIKRQSNSKHSYQNGDSLKYVPISIEEFKNLNNK